MNTQHDLEQIQRQTGLGQTYPQSFVGLDNVALWLEAGAGTGDGPAPALRITHLAG